MSGEAILVVDDNAINLKFARVLLSGEGYHVETARSADEALKLLESFEPKLILMDIQLPGMDGLELTGMLRANDRYARLPIVALTAYAMTGDEQRARAAGCDGYVSKPVDMDALLGVVREMLDRNDSGGDP